MSNTESAADVVVIGGGLAGLAAAARLAKQRHRVELIEARDRLGGSWAAYERAGVVVDDRPPVLDLPAPWRDLFRKTGRPLEAELARAGLTLEPAPPTRFVFDDGTELVLPHDRRGQSQALTEAYGLAVANAWRDLVDGFAPVWQAARGLGLESELGGRAQFDAATRTALRGRQSLTDLARTMPHPHLGELVRLVGHRLGSDPELTPAWTAVELYVVRTFGRWTVGRSSRLVELLADRLALRGAEVRLGTPVQEVLVEHGRVTGVRLVGGEERGAPVVVAAVDPWQLYGRLLHAPPRTERRGVQRSKPARAPVVDVRVTAASGPEAPPSETVQFGPGAPVLTWTRPTPGGPTPSGTTPSGIVVTRHDLGGALDRSAGIAWGGSRSWLHRPPVRSEVTGLFFAGPQGRGGAAAWATVLSGALAAAAGHERIRRRSESSREHGAGRQF